MKFQDLYRSVFAIFRIEGNQAKVVGTGFVINTNPFYVLTCNHVVGEGNEQNVGNVRYAITKRSDTSDNFDIRQLEISYLAVKKIVHKPEFDLAVLEIDPSTNLDVASKLDIANAKALEISFDKKDRELGSPVEWLSTAASGDLTLTPRFFKGNVITDYITNHPYEYMNSQGTISPQVITGAHLFEVDQLFIPGSSGSPILSFETGKVIGYVHGFKSWPIPTNNEIIQKVEVTESGNLKEVDLKYKLPFMASLSLGIDARTIEEYLKTSNFISS